MAATAQRKVPRVRWLVPALLAVVAFLSGLKPAFEMARDAATWVADIVIADPPERESAGVVDEILAETRRALPWERPPTVYEPSVAYFRAHFDALDPRRTHPIGQLGATQSIHIADLVSRIPQFNGFPVLVEGTLAGRSQITIYEERITSEAFFIGEDRDPKAVAVCRVPLRAGAEHDLRPTPQIDVPREFQIGERVVAEGVILADGLAPIESGGAPVRIVYLLCSSVGHVSDRPP